ncbi:hypothetical protein HRbin33_02031 [bacterium HR33]|nr:hypothetical protein HRbin33_02031 [bacterium HR33]
MNRNTTYRIAPEVLVADLDGEAVVLDVRQKTYYQLNETAAAIWHALEGGADENSVVRRLVVQFAVDEETALADTRRLLAELEERSLVTR